MVEAGENGRKPDPTTYKRHKSQRKVYEEKCNNLHILPVRNALWTLPFVTPEKLWKPDLLHTLDLGMVNKLVAWSIKLLETFEPLPQIFDTLWVALTHHPKLERKPNKPWRRIKQKQGTESRTAAHLLLAVLEATIESFDPQMYIPEITAFSSRKARKSIDEEVLDDEDLDTLKTELEEALFALAAFLDFHRFAYFDFHSCTNQDEFDPADTDNADESTLHQMHLALSEFFDRMDVLRKYKALHDNKDAGKEESKKAVDSRRSKYKAKLDTKALKAKQPALKRREKDARDDENSKTEIGCPKLHLMTHFCRYILMCGALKPLSTSNNELCLKVYKEGFVRSNKDMYVNQVFRYVSHRDAIIIKMANLRFLLERGDLSEEARQDIQKYTGLYRSRKERLDTHKEIRKRLKPKAEVERAEKRKQQLERRERIKDNLSKCAGEVVGNVDNTKDIEDDDSDRSSIDFPLENDDNDTVMRAKRRTRRREQALGLDTQIYEISKAGLDNSTTTFEEIEHEQYFKAKENAPPIISHKLTHAHTTGEPRITNVGTAASALETFRGLPPETFKLELRRVLEEEQLWEETMEHDFDSVTVIPYTRLDMPRRVFQYPRPDGEEKYILWCTPPGMKYDKGHRHRRNDFVAYVDGTQTYLANEHVGSMELLFNVQLDREGGRRNRLERSFVALKPTIWKPRSRQQAVRRTFMVQWSPEPLKIVPLEDVRRAVSVVPIIGPYRWNQSYNPPEGDAEFDALIRNAKGFVVNNRVDDETFNTYF
ncbi:hypothetical protein BJ508DRAFT_334455 [Ascobolus immersus RN42]|uniref:Uncharacterized protein n=1 Tax=Ascobolus immersus RN42 TaxID=1160509 RepID=A0A3N4HTR9_ASCIM|nr:hypothetical protein BJ508DRAFT_334455 [Ascobolus immersus RN42]